MKLVAAKCPSCGANIEVDEDSSQTRCEFCGGLIIVDDAIAKYKLEISGAVEIKNMPTLENYLELGARHYNDGEYKEAFVAYSKADELDSNNYLIISRKGFSKSLSANYMDFETNSVVNGTKNAYKLLESSKEDKVEEIRLLFLEATLSIKKLKNFAVSFYKKSKFDIEEMNGYVERLVMCLDALEYFYNISPPDNSVKILIINNIVDIIDEILKNKRYYTGQYNRNVPLTSLYFLNSDLKYSLQNKRRKYENEKKMLDSVVTLSNDANNIVETSKGSMAKCLRILFNILCYVQVVISGLWVLYSFAIGAVLSLILWLVVLIIFIPSVKREIIKKSDKLKKFIIPVRIILIIIAFFVMIFSYDLTYEGTWNSENGMKVIFESSEAIIKTSDGKVITGEYTAIKNDNNNYSIEVNGKDGVVYNFYYINSDNDKLLCYKVNGECLLYLKKSE